MSGSHAPVTEVLATARRALDEHAWSQAFEVLSEADRSGPLPGAALEMLTEAAWWSGRGELVLEVGERAFAAHLAEGDRAAAALVAMWLAEQHGMRRAVAAAGGWFARAERLLADEPEGRGHARLAWMRGFVALAIERDPRAAVPHLDDARRIAVATGDRNVEVRSLHDKGRALCAQGDFAGGAALMDEAMVAAVGGELDPIPAGIVYCSMIGVCSLVEDYERAAEWTDATTRWCERFSIQGFPGVCRVHRAEILRLRGAWANAEEEARRACEELPRFNLFTGLGEAFHEIAEVRRRMGDFTGAEDAYLRAHEFGRDPEPGLSLLRLAQGRTAAAVAGVARVLSDDSLEPLARVRPLAARVEVGLVAGDLDAAKAAAAELATIAEAVGTRALRAKAEYASGVVHLAGGEAAAAVPELRRALQGWRQIDAPFEVAEVRVALGRAYAAEGDPDGAVMELRAARDAFERLGAAWEAERTGEVLGALAEPAAPERAGRAFLFSDIVRSTDLVAAIGDAAWEDLLSWHDETLRSIFAAHGGEVGHHTGDGFFVSFADAGSALSCAVSVQRALAGHRRDHGFAPSVRIGVHAAEATRRGRDYSGAEVHRAARIAAMADGAEILASEAVLDEAGGRFPVGDRRSVTLKGLPDPVVVAAVGWR